MPRPPTYTERDSGNTLTMGSMVSYGEVVELSCEAFGQSKAIEKSCVYNREEDKYTLGLGAPYNCPGKLVFLCHEYFRVEARIYITRCYTFLELGV